MRKNPNVGELDWAHPESQPPGLAWPVGLAQITPNYFIFLTFFWIVKLSFCLTGCWTRGVGSLADWAGWGGLWPDGLGFRLKCALLQSQIF